MIEQWQELKETIIEMRDNDGTGTQQEVCKFLANYMEILEKQMQESKTGEWIPVSERLPKKNVWVLVTVEQSGNRFQEIMRRNNYIEAWTDNIDNYTYEITAWMPLPEPYEPQESEDKE